MAQVVPASLGPVLSALPPELVLAVPIAFSALLPPASRQVAALAAIILLGVPHGALDGELARASLGRRFPRAWFLVFSLPYLALAGLVLLAWQFAPLATLAGFLALSVLHFGMEDAASGRVAERIVRGGLPVALPVLFHPEATARLLGTIAGVPLAAPPGWLVAASLAWLLPAALWLLSALRSPGVSGRLLEPALLVAIYVALPPVTAFAAYFVCVHAPHHVAAIVAHPSRAPRVHSRATAVRHAAPVTALTLLLGAMLWPAYAGPPADRLLEVTLQGLAALTLPHMMLEAWLERRGR